MIDVAPTGSPRGVPDLSIDPFARKFLADPYASHVALRDAGPLVWLSAIGCYAMARHGEVRLR